MLIDDRVPPFLPGDERPVWEPDPRTCAWIVAAIVFTVGAFVVPGFGSFVLLCAAVGCGGHAITRVLPWGDGLRDYRQ